MKACYLVCALTAIACARPKEDARGATSVLQSAAPSAATSPTQPSSAQPADARWRNAAVVFGSQAECRATLGSSDAFTRAMSGFDRAVRSEGVAEIDERQLLAFAAAQCQEWPADRRASWQEAATKLGTALADLHLELPERIAIFTTSGKEEFSAAYTRGAAIILPSSELQSARATLLAHELFHVASRYRPAIRDGIYGLFGFQRAKDFRYPAQLEPLRITNPDAYHYEHSVRVTDQGVEVDVVPILQAAKALPDLAGADIGSLLSVQLADASGAAPKVRPVEATDYLQRVSINSPYVIHPEELAADNFAHLLAKRMGATPKLDHAEILDALEKKL